MPYLTWRGETAARARPEAAAGGRRSRALVTTDSRSILGGARPASTSLYVFLAVLALGRQRPQDRAKARLQGLRAAGGYLSHVGVAVMLLGFVASGGYDQSTKVTLDLDQPNQVGERTLTFVGFLEKTSPRDKDTLVIEVETADGDTYRSYPRFFRNERTGQLMTNPHVRSTALADFYVSPLQYDPGEAPGAAKLVELRQGQSADRGRVRPALRRLRPRGRRRQRPGPDGGRRQRDPGGAGESPVPRA